MTHTSMKARNYALLLLVITAAVVAVGASSSLVAADACTANLSTVTTTAPNSGSYIGVQVPVSANCASTTTANGSLYAVGDAYDTTTSTDLGSVNTALTPVNAANIYNGELSFSIPSTAQGDTLQISVSVYNSQYGQLLTTTSETIQAAPTSYQTGYIAQNNYPQQNGNPQNNYPSQNSLGSQNGNYPSQNSFGTQNSNYAPQGRSHGSHHNYGSTNSYQYQQQSTVTVTQPVPFVIPPDNTWLIDTVIAVIIAIATVGAIAFAILATRNRQPYQQTRAY
ncbi:MAG: hypothetical protein ACLPY5_15360 [Candidatus Bathyarchaeia archaeon]